MSEYVGKTIKMTGRLESIVDNTMTFVELSDATMDICERLGRLLLTNGGLVRVHITRVYPDIESTIGEYFSFYVRITRMVFTKSGKQFNGYKLTFVDFCEDNNV